MAALGGRGGMEEVFTQGHAHDLRVMDVLTLPLRDGFTGFYIRHISADHTHQTCTVYCVNYT